jgi:hypothetical protein
MKHIIIIATICLAGCAATIYTGHDHHRFFYDQRAIHDQRTIHR